MTTKTPFDPDDDDDAEDIVKVLKKRRFRRFGAAAAYSFRFFLLLFFWGSLENNRARNPYRERIVLSPLDVL